MTFKEQVAYRAKAIVAAFGVSVVAFIGWLVENPDTARRLEDVIPAPYAQFVPIVLAGIATTWFVHRVPNKSPAAAPVAEPLTETTALKLTQDSGTTEFIGDAH